MSSTAAPAAATTRQEEVPESAEAIADRILGTTSSSYEMANFSSTQANANTSAPPFSSGGLPQIVSPSGNVPAVAPAVTSVEAGTAAAPLADRASEPLSGDLANGPVSPSDIVSRALVITIIIPSTDSRHRYVLDDAYLARRNVSPPEGIITNITVYQLKELIYRDWRQEWEAKPSNPSSIRLIHMGRMLEDNHLLRDNRFQVGETPHVVHMNVRPELTEEEDGGKLGKTTSRARSRRQADDGEERTPGCRCVLM